jgi:hypothetical protein
MKGREGHNVQSRETVKTGLGALRSEWRDKKGRMRKKVGLDGRKFRAR